jgi:hypothetical protein
MNSKDQTDWNNLTDRLLASLESSRKMERQLLVDFNTDAVKRQRERSRPKEDKASKSSAKIQPKTNNKFHTRISTGSK